MMTNFHQTIKDNAEAGIRACQLVYEKLTGKCWHDDIHTVDDDRIALCGKCGEQVVSEFNEHANPPLLTSLDAWRPLWEGLSTEQKDTIDDILGKNMDYYYSWEAQPHHHLEAALRTLDEECPECHGQGFKCNDDPTKVTIGGYDCTCDDYKFAKSLTEGNYHSEQCESVEPCTCTNGRVSLFEIWRREHEMDKH
jgi:hypothetical protein